MGKSSKLQAIVNKNIRDYFQLGTKVNVLKINRNANLEHELKISEIFTKARFEGHSVVVGGKLNNGQIPDICLVDLESPIIYEVMNSEKELKESKDYPFKIKEVKI